MRPTIKDVAKRAGVSPSTVSLVLRKRDCPISDRTKSLVYQAARELRYRPNQLAVGLVTKRTNLIGLIIPDNNNLFLAAYSNEIEIVARDLGYTIIFGIAHNDVKNTIHHLRGFDDRGVDGILLVQSAFPDINDTDACLEAINELRVPIVLSDRVPKTCTLESVKPNDFLGGYMALKHLLEQGHTQIGIVTGPMYFDNCIERINGCKKALAEAGIPFDPALVYEGDFLITGGIMALPYLLGKNITAVFAFNDMMAYGIYKESRNYDLLIPADLSVIGFDDLFFSDVIQPPLTTIEYPIKEMARTVVNRLVSLIQGEGAHEPAALIIDPVLKVKGSVKRITKSTADIAR